MGKRSMKTMFGGAGFYIALLLCVAAVGVGGYVAFFADGSSDTAQDPGQQTAAPAESVTVPEYNPDPTPETVVETVEPEPIAVQAPEIEVDDTPVVAEAPQVAVSPLTGDTVAAFSMDNLTYNETMGDWRTHDGIDIAAQTGTNVLAAQSGTVNTVYDDHLMGTTVVVDHAGGYQTVYAGLQAKPPVAAGDKVTAGQVVGAVGATAAAESAQGPHLHFSVTKDGIPVDPNRFLNQ